MFVYIKLRGWAIFIPAIPHEDLEDSWDCDLILPLIFSHSTLTLSIHWLEPQTTLSLDIIIAMLSIATFFALVALPAIINAQSLTTYMFSINGQGTSIVVPLPQAPTTTVYKTMPVATVTQTTAYAPAVATQTIVVTAPANQISSIANEIPQSYQVPVESLNPGAVVPITINDYTTSINLPSSASVPTGAVTLSPVIVAPQSSSTVVSSIQTAIKPLTSAAAGSASTIASSATTQASSIASSAGGQASAIGSSAGAQASSLTSQASELTPTPIVPIPITPASLASAAANSASSALATLSSNPNSAIDSATSGLAATSSQATSLAGAASSKIAVASSQATSLAGSASSGISPITSSDAIPTGIVTDTSSFTTSTRSGTTTSSTAIETSTSTSSLEESTSATATTSSPASASTAAPPNSGAVERRGSGVLGWLSALGLGILVLL
ncbi:MAG: hypothetical protein LQ343_000451 [Gyalolechia ehrenbergii]|nr:MAG: hypothetical protein LQ343_000451 [Gyalolechia ehrenbergii]